MSHVGNDLWADTLSDALDERNETLKQTLNSLEATVVEFRQEYDAMLPVVDAAIEYVNLRLESHQSPVSEERKIKVAGALFNAVLAFEESKL